MRRLILESTRPYRGLIVVILIAMLLQTAAILATPWPLKVVLDNAVGSHPLPGWIARVLGPTLSANRTGIVIAAALSVVLIAAINSMTNFFSFYYSESVGQRVANNMRMRVFCRLDRFSLSYFDKTQAATILSTITDDISTIETFITYSILVIFTDLLIVVGMFIVLLALNFNFALVALGATPVVIVFALIFRKEVVRTTRDLRRKQSDVVAILQESLQSIRVIAAFDGQAAEEAELSNATTETVNAALKARRVRSLLWPMVGLTVSVCTGFVVWRGASLILSGAMTVGDLTVFIAYLTKFFSPFQDLDSISNNFAQATVAVERIRSILDIDVSIPERSNACKQAPKVGEIIFENVDFSYDGMNPILKDVGFTINPGQLIGIVGPTGCGKSTAVNLIPRFYDPIRGRILIDGIDARDYDLHALRSQVGIVLQDTILFRGTVRENIAYGRPGATLDEIIAAARQADADEFISKLPHGYDTSVGESGLSLSGGQRQRLGIARAIIRKATILILDEPTAALDVESEKIVMKALDQVMLGRTVITIAHRLSTIQNSDKIFVFKDGSIAEQGTHDVLLALGGVYANLYHIQNSNASSPS
jgi:ABC-type multidrug transport system fused ATPase/permease subunit